MIIPSIDLINGKAVQLQQGKKLILEEEDVFALADHFSLFGDLAVIDLDAALGNGDNRILIKKLLAKYDCRVGGGIRTAEDGFDLLRAGARKIIIGTKATPKFLSLFPKEKVIVAIDSLDNEVMAEGWTKSTQATPIDKIRQLQPYCSEFLFTNINKEGLQKGTDLQQIKAIQDITSLPITAAGGISSLFEVTSLIADGVKVQLGMAIYTGLLNLMDAYILSLNFGKFGGFIPTIVQDTAGQILMFARSTPESLRQTFESRKGTYFSSSRQQLWTKGETSGNFQIIRKVRFDCDQDTLLFTVDQEGAACHTKSYSCFSDKDFSLKRLYSNIKNRIKEQASDSYSYKLSKNEPKILSKIKEESLEVINYSDDENLIWEIADLTYFLLLLMASKEISPEQVMNELRGRMK